MAAINAALARMREAGKHNDEPSDDIAAARV
jgi:hypothetical protein